MGELDGPGRYQSVSLFGQVSLISISRIFICRSDESEDVTDLFMESKIGGFENGNHFASEKPKREQVRIFRRREETTENIVDILIWKINDPEKDHTNLVEKVSINQKPTAIVGQIHVVKKLIN
jgi:hypothetical protein